MNYLLERNLLPPIILATQLPNTIPNYQLISYGNYFADNIGAGHPERPHEAVVNHMTARVPVRLVLQRTQGNFSAAFHHPDWFNPQVDVEALARLVWEPGAYGTNQNPSITMRYRLMLTATPNIPLAFFVGLAAIFHLADSPDETAQRQDQDYAMDNFFHYTLGDLRDLQTPPTGATFAPVPVVPGEQNLRLYPMEPEHLAGSPEEAAAWDAPRYDAAFGVSVRLVNQKLLAGADFGAQKYGAILFQLARKFFEGSRAEPELTELVKAGNDVPGWNTGYLEGHGGLDEMSLTMPHTYLGGMPNICSGSTSADPCATGQPTWPFWIQYRVQSDDLTKREVNNPGRITRAAMIYLGWATHMIQDAAMPHHVANWTGAEHRKQDELGNNPDYFSHEVCDSLTEQCEPSAENSMDRYMLDEVNARFGSPSNPRLAEDVCRDAGINDSQVVAGSLNWQSVYPVFLRTARDAYVARQESLPTQPLGTDKSIAREYVKNAILGTMTLLACVAPGTAPDRSATTRVLMRLTTD